MSDENDRARYAPKGDLHRRDVGRERVEAVLGGDDIVPLGLQVGQILPSDAILAVKRVSATSVTIDAGAGVTVAFVYELPERAALRTFRLPGGRELGVVP